MKVLVRKELVELGLSFVPILLAVCLVWLWTSRVESALIWPAEFRMQTVLLTAAGGGLLFACTQLAGERIRGTMGFLVHRGAGLEGCFRVKAWTGATASVLLGIVPPFVLAVVHATILGESRVVHWSRVAEYFAAATAGASAYAITALALCSRRGAWSETILAVVGVAGWFMVSIPSTFFVAERLGLFANDPRMLAGFAAVQLLLAIALLRLAGRILASWRDPSLTLESSHHVAALVLGVFLWIPIQVVLVAEIQNEFGKSFHQRAPIILQDKASGEFILAVSHGDYSYAALRDGRLVPDERLLEFHPYGSEKDLEIVLDPGHPIDRRGSEELASRMTRVGPWSWEGVAYPGGGFAVWDQGTGSQLGGYNTTLWVDHGAGCLRLFALARQGFGENSSSTPPPEIPYERVIEKPAGRFSRSTTVFDAIVFRPSKREDGITYIPVEPPRVASKCIVDPEDGSLWRLDPDFSTPLQDIELPNVDRVVGVWNTGYVQSSLRVGRFQPSLQRCIRGEKGDYQWNGNELVPTDESSPNSYLVSAEVADSLVEIQAIYTDPDPLFPTVEVRNARTGAVLLTHRYAPIESKDFVLAGVIQLGAILRPPVLDAISYFQSASEPERFNQDLEPLLANRSRGWILAAAFLLSIGLARIAMRRARERGGSSAVVGVTAILVAAIGVTGFLMVWMLESRKPRRREEARVEPRPEPVVLIETARAT